MKERPLLLSERYTELIQVQSGKFVDNICGPISDDARADIAEIMRQYAEPAKIYPNRYDNYEIYTTALEIAIRTFNDIKGGPYIWFERSDFDKSWSNPLATTFAPFLFDVIELQFTELSDGEKHEFQSEINATFCQHNVPWLLHEGRMVKIDAVQFELDLRQKALEQLRELKDCEPKFQAAYGELLSACESLQKNGFASAISNAGKSYESVLKVICGLQKGNADKLTKSYLETRAGTLPATMTPEGFREKVMMALPFIRNNSASDHGAGATPAVISKPLAKLAINLAAAMNTYLIEEYRDNLATEQDETPVSSSGNIDNELPF